jgi:nitrite reductase/ring-hydroxylating ferredoxin subunit
LSGVDAAGESATAGAEPPQALIGYRTNEEWQALVDEVGALIASLDEIGDAEQRQKVFAALEGIDAIHREALHRLVRLFKEGVLEQVVTDPAIRTLMGMYDLLPPEEPGCAKVWDFLAPDEKAGPPPAARSEGHRGSVAARPPGEPPHWSPVSVSELPAEGEAVVCTLEEGSVLVAKVRGEFLAADTHCAHHDAAMPGGMLNGYSWVCPHGPGCIYDLRSGARLGGGPALACLPVRQDARGRLLIGFGMPFAPRLPAF